MLSDDKKRALYDQYGEAGVKSAVGGGSSAYTVLFLYKFWEHYIYERMNYHKIIRWSAEIVVNIVIDPMHISCLIFWEKNCILLYPTSFGASLR